MVNKLARQTTKHQTDCVTAPSENCPFVYRVTVHAITVCFAVNPQIIHLYNYTSAPWTVRGGNAIQRYGALKDLFLSLGAMRQSGTRFKTSYQHNGVFFYSMAPQIMGKVYPVRMTIIHWWVVFHCIQWKLLKTFKSRYLYITL